MNPIPPRPSVGRIVHYVSHGTPLREDGSQAYSSVCRAAVIAEVPAALPALAEPLDGCANGTQGIWAAHLAVFNPQGMFFNPDALRDEEGHAGGTWHFPEFVPAAGE